MKLAPEIAEAVANAARAWAESTTDLPLTIRKTADGAVCTQALPKQRYTKAEFAAELGMHRNTFAKIEALYGLAPAASDGCYDRETVEDVKRWLRNEEKRTKAPKTRGNGS